MNATALWVVGAGETELRRSPLPSPGPAEVLVRAAFSGVSRGTESLVLAGRVPTELHDTMRAPFQEGRFPWPVKYGYASVGQVESGALPAGAWGFVLAPHQDRYVVPAAAFVPLPEALPPARAVLGANLETALNVVWDAGVGPADRVAVVGAGVVGSLVAWLAQRIAGTEVELIDVVDSRAALAHALGVPFVSPDRATPDCDVVIEASGAESGLTTALHLAGPEGLVVVASWYGSAPVSAPLGGAFHSRRLTVRSSQVGQLPPSRRPRWSHRRRLAAALRLLADAPELDVLVSSEGPFSTADVDLVRVAAQGSTALCHRIVY